MGASYSESNEEGVETCWEAVNYPLAELAWRKISALRAQDQGLWLQQEESGRSRIWGEVVRW